MNTTTRQDDLDEITEKFAQLNRFHQYEVLLVLHVLLLWDRVRTFWRRLWQA